MSQDLIREFNGERLDLICVIPFTFRLAMHKLVECDEEGEDGRLSTEPIAGTKNPEDGCHGTGLWCYFGRVVVEVGDWGAEGGARGDVAPGRREPVPGTGIGGAAVEAATGGAEAEAGGQESEIWTERGEAEMGTGTVDLALGNA
jgi:hypothetical protein